MFENVEARFVLRAAVATGLGVLGAVQLALGDGSISLSEGVDIVYAGGIVLGGYLGIGAVSKTVEPSVGRSADGS